MANSSNTSKPGAPAQQPSKGSPVPAGKPPVADDAKAKAAAADAAKHAEHSAAEHEKMKGRS